VERGAGEDGFTLAELLTAVVVIGVGIFGTMQLFLGSLHATSATTARSRAVELASRELDRMRGRPADAAVVAAGPDETIAGLVFHVAREAEWVGVGDDAQAERRLTVTVTWRDDTGDHLVRQDGLVGRGAGPATTTTAPPVAPAAPTGLAATTDPADPTSRVLVLWTGGTAATWEVQHALDPSFTAAVVDTTSLPEAARQLGKGGLSPGTTYWFRVRARGGNDPSAWSAWSTPGSVTTTGALSGTCRVGALAVGGSPATVDLADGRLGEPVTVEVSAQGTCAGLSVVVAPDGVNFVPRAMQPASGGVWRAQLEPDLLPVRWATGAHEVDVLDGATVVAQGVVVVCAGACPS
jgi:prepilin-type N-terminal cleavage/methylation domain-containing protein